MPLEIFKMPEVLNLLHDTLESSKTINKVSVFSPNGEKYGYNQYSLMIVMDFLIKYCIVIKDTNNFLYCMDELKKMVYSYNDHKELVLWSNELLGELIRLKLNLTDYRQPALSIFPYPVSPVEVPVLHNMNRETEREVL